MSKEAACFVDCKMADNCGCKNDYKTRCKAPSFYLHEDAEDFEDSYAAAAYSDFLIEEESEEPVPEQYRDPKTCESFWVKQCKAK